MRGFRRTGVTGVLLLAAMSAQAHDAAHDASGWSVDPLIAVLMFVSLSLQCIGFSRMGPARAAVAPGWRIGAYGAAMATLVLALFSPVDARADDQFSWHMLQHLLLMLVAAPLFALSNMHFVALYALPIRARRVVGRAMEWVPGAGAGSRHAAGPWLSAAAFVAGLWLWHAPVMFEAALAHRAVHTLEHLVFLFTAAVFWRMVMTAGNRRLSLASAVVLVTLVGLQGNLMAALITLAPAPLYTSYAVPGGLLDQQVAGLIMWVPAGVIYLASTLWTLRKLMQ
jgi:cytochrome c oxidase assembly factor CtaG